MIDFFMEHVPCGREEAVARFRSMVIQCFSDIKGSYYRSGREFRRDGLRLTVWWWGAFMLHRHSLYRHEAPSSLFRQTEIEEFSRIPRDDLYEDIESYRAGRRAICLARNLVPLDVDEEAPEASGEEVADVGEESQGEKSTTTTTLPPTPTALPPASTPVTPTRTATLPPAEAALAWDKSVETGKKERTVAEFSQSGRKFTKWCLSDFIPPCFLQNKKEEGLASRGRKQQSLKKKKKIRIAWLQQQQQQKLSRSPLAWPPPLLCLRSSKTKSLTLAGTPITKLFR